MTGFKHSLCNISNTYINSKDQNFGPNLDIEDIIYIYNNSEGNENENNMAD